MDLNDLKKTWDLMSAGKELDEGQLRNMLGKRTKSLIERIDRNIKIGFVALLVLIIFLSLGEFIFPSKNIEELYNEMPIPNWVISLGTFSYALISFTFIYFVFSYYWVKRKCDVNCNLKDTLKKIIKTLVLYQRLFYLALITILISVASAFISGMFIGTEHNAELNGIQISDIETSQLLLILLITILFLALFGGGIFLFLRWGFRKLYGNYITKLKTTLKELEEIDE